MSSYFRDQIKFTFSENSLAKFARLRKTLKQHYSAPEQEQFKALRNGAIIFAIGLICVLTANSSLPPSIKQELLVLCGLVVGGIGFILAMTAYMRIVISRLVKFFGQR